MTSNVHLSFRSAPALALALVVSGALACAQSLFLLQLPGH
jgi:hypothetical protein